MTATEQHLNREILWSLNSSVVIMTKCTEIQALNTLFLFHPVNIIPNKSISKHLYIYIHTRISETNKTHLLTKFPCITGRIIPNIKIRFSLLLPCTLRWTLCLLFSTYSPPSCPLPLRQNRKLEWWFYPFLTLQRYWYETTETFSISVSLVKVLIWLSLSFVT